MDTQLPIWQRLGLTIVAILVFSYVAGLIWAQVTGFALPAYAAGVVGGLTALPVWELLKRFKAK
ncbi:hypothetical protein [Sneathiella chinensis]|nr:hypothetical protein [Sneathiella chinensis]